MTPKSLKLLAVATVVAVAGATWSLNAHRSGSGVEVSGPVFPGLIEQVNDVAKVSVEYREKTLTMVRGAKGGWTLTESDGYAVSAKAAEKVVVQLADLNLYELKTRKPDLYGRLHVADPRAEDAEARQIKVFDADGKVLADLVAGRKRYNLAGARREGVYIRKPGNDQTWLAAGELDVEVKPGDWLESEIVDIQEDTVQSATVRHPDGELVTVIKDGPGSKKFTLLGVPAGKELKFDTDPKTLAGVIDQLNMDDARKDGRVEFSHDKTIQADFATEDGLRLKIYVVNQDDVDWARLEASAATDAPAPKDGSETAQARADAINERVQGWVYALPGFKASRIKRRIADMLRDKKPAS